uniref:hypothetical protein n=1 Tax=Lentibacillus saliphilus TaxID=2737028 RepID=UPI001C30D253|nr:hypothetical protein [Lentibacillus saliphilus]
MNKVAIALNTVGALSIVGGFIVGLNLYKIPMDGMYSSEENYAVLLTWIAAGFISGIIMFGFAEIVNLLDEKKHVAEEQTDILKGIHTYLKTRDDDKESLGAVDEPEQKEINVELYEDLKELRNELKGRGYGNDIIETMIAEKKRKQ